MEKQDFTLHHTLQEHNDTVAGLLFELERPDKEKLQTPEAKLFQYVHDYAAFDKELYSKEQELHALSSILDDLSGKLSKSTPPSGAVRTLEPGEVEESFELFESLEKEYKMLEHRFNLLKEEIETIEVERKMLISKAEKETNTKETAFMQLLVKYEDRTTKEIDPRAN